MAMAGLVFNNVVKFRVRFHRAVLVGKDVTVKITEERKIPSDMADSQLVRIGKDVGGDAALAQAGMKLDHRLNRNKDVAEKRGEFLEAAAKAGSGADLVVKVLFRQQPGFKAEQQRRVVDESPDFIERHLALLRNPPSSNRVIEIDQDFAKIEDDDFWGRID